MREYLMAVTTIDSEASARSLARALVERRLVACVNVVPKVTSIYRWEGEVEEGSECLLFMKTRADRYEALSSAIADSHPYDVPELIALPIERGSDDYLAWVGASVAEPESSG